MFTVFNGEMLQPFATEMNLSNSTKGHFDAKSYLPEWSTSGGSCKWSPTSTKASAAISTPSASGWLIWRASSKMTTSKCYSYQSGDLGTDSAVAPTIRAD